MFKFKNYKYKLQVETILESDTSQNLFQIIYCFILKTFIEATLFYFIDIIGHTYNTPQIIWCYLLYFLIVVVISCSYYGKNNK